MEHDLNQAKDQLPKKRFGLIAARIGASFAHRLSIPMAISEPKLSTITHTAMGALAPRTRTTLSRQTPLYEYGANPRDGSLTPVKALPGATVYLEVQDISRLEAALIPQIKWKCLHRNCQREKQEFATKEDLLRAHGKNADLVDEAARDPMGGQAHVYMGVIEIPATEPKKVKGDDGKERVVQGTSATVMLVSDEE